MAIAEKGCRFISENIEGGQLSGVIDPTPVLGEGDIPTIVTKNVKM